MILFLLNCAIIMNYVIIVRCSPVALSGGAHQGALTGGAHQGALTGGDARCNQLFYELHCQRSFFL